MFTATVEIMTLHGIAHHGLKLATMSCCAASGHGEVTLCANLDSPHMRRISRIYTTRSTRTPSHPPR